MHYILFQPQMYLSECVRVCLIMIQHDVTVSPGIVIKLIIKVFNFVISIGHIAVIEFSNLCKLNLLKRGKTLLYVYLYVTFWAMTKKGHLYQNDLKLLNMSCWMKL